MTVQIRLRRMVRAHVVWLLLVLAMDAAVASAAFAQAYGEPGGGEEEAAAEQPSTPSMPMQGMKKGMGGMESMPMEEGMKMSCTCESAMMGLMQGPLGIAVVALSVLLLAAVAAVLGALTVFLLRRSRYPARGAAA